MILDGKALSNKILDEISKEHDFMLKKNGRRAGLVVVIVGDDKASRVYVKNKRMTCEKVGFFTETIDFSSNISEEELLKEIERLNSDERFDGILVQLPLPKHIDELKVLNAINPDKDVDGFHFNNIGKMVVGDDTGFLSCTPYGIMQLFDEYNINVEGKDVVIIGRSNIVGKPMALLLIQKRATVQVCNTRTKDMREKLKNADIVISAAGVPNLIGKEDVKKGAVVIDVGINRVEGKICGDVNFEEVKDIASYITPVPGGVGPMTIASLMKNTLKSYRMRVDKDESNF
ncbi:bifunctional methylenetetrahydrofolate dehydrogenase/methenyltetrahydrofolate cyclohydrolase FolD [Pseudostreptobacillus sp.]